MPELLEILMRHRATLQKAGWLWPQNGWETAARSVEPERLLVTWTVLDQWLANDPRGFVDTSGALLGGGRLTSLPLLTDILCWKHNYLLIAIADEASGTPQRVASLMAPLFQSEPQLASRLIALTLNGIPEADLRYSDRMLQRTLQIAGAYPDRLAIPIVQLLRHQNRRIRSKAALLLARANGNPTIVYQRFARETDARVRANLIEGLWKVDAPGKAEVLWKAAMDGDHRVVANALVGLCEMGDSIAVAQLHGLTSHSSADMRAAAAWALGETLNPSYVDILTRLFRDENGKVKRNALRALVRLRQAQQSAA